MRRERNISKVLMGMLLMVAITGCTMRTGSYIKPQSHFDYPNSNLIPQGQVSATVSKTLWGPYGILEVTSPVLEEEVINKALAQKGGDVMTNYCIEYKVKMIIPGLISTVEIKVTGTSNKMEVGKQQLR